MAARLEIDRARFAFRGERVADQHMVGHPDQAQGAPRDRALHTDDDGRLQRVQAGDGAVVQRDDRTHRVTDDGMMRVKVGKKTVAEIPARKLADEAPIYFREFREAAYMQEVRAFSLDGIPDTTDVAGDLRRLLAYPSIASKNWVYRQYDHMVRTNTVALPGMGAGVR